MDNPLTPQAVPKYTTIKEFEIGKRLTPTALEYVEGKTIGKKAEWCDADGCVWIMRYIDHDHNDIERYFDTKYPSFNNSLKFQKVRKNAKYLVSYEPGTKGFKEWKWQPI